ncbi:unnamed protein product [Callosobruchus maculatus]|uniref:Uncharacterized protein n=1 Tax=Callosobruchus maculatus TaxID=64391 RepID=A0A653CGW9_CALMS|nr:unnamed protein product [Callosobruchus maculatus]
MTPAKEDLEACSESEVGVSVAEKLRLPVVVESSFSAVVSFGCELVDTFTCRETGVFWRGTSGSFSVTEDEDIGTCGWSVMHGYDLPPSMGGPGAGGQGGPQHPGALLGLGGPGPGGGGGGAPPPPADAMAHPDSTDSYVTFCIRTPYNSHECDRGGVRCTDSAYDRLTEEEEY